MTEHALKLRKENMKQHGFGTDVMKSVKVCPGCRKVVQKKKLRCTSCGAKLPHKSLFQIYQAQHRSCGSCGQVVSDRASYCLHCGAKLPEMKA